jgi:signal transduction histidine kinase
MHTSCSFRSRRSRRPKFRSVAAQFRSGLTHDLSQSLSLIAEYAELADQQLAQADFDREQVREALQNIHQEALGSRAILARLLSLTPEAQESTEPILVRQLLVEASELTESRWRYAARATGRDIQVRVDADRLAVVLGCRAGLQLAFTSLILDAVDALPEGGTIDLRAWCETQTVEVEVAASPCRRTAVRLSFPLV